MDGICEEETLRREMRKIQSAIFFSLREFVCDFMQKKCENIAKSCQKVIPAYSGETVILKILYQSIQMKIVKHNSVRTNKLKIK